MKKYAYISFIIASVLHTLERIAAQISWSILVADNNVSSYLSVSLTDNIFVVILLIISAGLFLCEYRSYIFKVFHSYKGNAKEKLESQSQIQDEQAQLNFECKLEKIKEKNQKLISRLKSN